MKTIKSVAALIALLLCVFLVSCSAFTRPSGSYSSSDLYNEVPGSDSAPLPELSNGTENKTGQTSETESMTGGRKVIFSSSFVFQTTQFEESCNRINEIIAKYGGYVESSDIRTNQKSRTANYTARVPVDKYFDMLSDTETVGSVVNRSENNRDVTDDYFDIEARLSALRTKEDRLLALLEEAEKIDDIVVLNDALENTVYEIETLTGKLRKYDSLISYATVSVQINEVADIADTPSVSSSFGDRIMIALNTSLKGLQTFGEYFVIILVALLPILIPIAVIIFVIVFLVSHGKKKKAKMAAKLMSSQVRPADPGKAGGDTSAPGADGPSDQNVQNRG
ncbi:MAG: DUF4349 domain-containing protein [Clostridia bacterium]|nr:DUF4349 domain-containing protein [Clostridia bacterium]